MSEEFKVQIIPYPNNGGPKSDGFAPRVETGAVQFGNDWPGYFLRGDNAIAVAMMIGEIGKFLNAIPDQTKVEIGGVGLAMAFMQLNNLREDIISSVVVKETKNDE